MSSPGREKKKTGKGSESKGFSSKLRQNTMEIVALVAAASIMLIILTLSWGPQAGTPPATGGTGGAGEDVQAPAPAEVAPCVTDNPELSQEQCWDLYYNDLALTQGDSTKCALIKNANMRRNCERFF
jgi:hypothetical protein